MPRKKKTKNPVAKELSKKQFRRQIVPNKKEPIQVKLAQEEFREFVKQLEKNNKR